MVSNLKGGIILNLPTTYSIDTAKREILANNVSQRKVVDKNYGGHGEVETIVPTVQNISVNGLPSSLIASIANDRVSGTSTATTEQVQITRFDQNNVKGVY